MSYCRTRAGGRCGQAQRHAHLLPCSPGRPDPFSVRSCIRRPAFLLFFRFVSSLPRSRSPGRLKRALAFEFGQVRHQPFVHAARQQQQLRCLLADTSMCGLFLAASERVGGDVNSSSPGRASSAQIVGEGALCPRLRCGCWQSAAVPRSSAWCGLRPAFLQHQADSFQNPRTFFLVLRQVLKQAEQKNALVQPERIASMSCFLQDLARTFSGRCSVHHARTKRGKAGNSVGVVHDEHAAHVQLTP